MTHITYRIAAAELLAFVEEQIGLVEATPIPHALDGLVPGELPRDELPGVWLAAGLASQIAVPLLDEPGRFVRPVEPPVEPAHQPRNEPSAARTTGSTATIAARSSGP